MRQRNEKDSKKVKDRENHVEKKNVEESIKKFLIIAGSNKIVFIKLTIVFVDHAAIIY